MAQTTNAGLRFRLGVIGAMVVLAACTAGSGGDTITTEGRADGSPTSSTATDPTSVDGATETTVLPSTTPQTATPTTSSTTGPVAESALRIPLDWFTANVMLFDGFHIVPVLDGIVGERLGTWHTSNVGWSLIARDPWAGFVTVAGPRMLHHWVQGSSMPIVVEPEAVADGAGTIRSLLEVVRHDDLLVAIFTIDAPSDSHSCEPPAFAFVDLATGASVDGVATTWSIESCDAQPSITQRGLTAQLEPPDWAQVARGEADEPLPPVPSTDLVVRDAHGVEVRHVVTTDEQPFAVLHDFDGRHVLVSREAYEPALAPRHFMVIDVWCAECSFGFDAPFNAPSATFIAHASVPVGAADAGKSTGCEPVSAIAPQPELGAEIDALRVALIEAASTCDITRLAELTGITAPSEPREVFPFQIGHAGSNAGFMGAVASKASILGDIVVSLEQPPSMVDGSWRWPGFGLRPWEHLNDAERTAARAFLEDQWSESSVEPFEQWFNDGGTIEFPTVVITYDPNANTWRFEYWLS